MRFLGFFEARSFRGWRVCGPHITFEGDKKFLYLRGQDVHWNFARDREGAAGSPLTCVVSFTHSCILPLIMPAGLSFF